jgi:hypothetical protein
MAERKKRPAWRGSLSSASVLRAHGRGGRLPVPVVQKSPDAVNLLAQPNASLYSPLVLRVLPIALLYHLLIHCSHPSSHNCFATGSISAHTRIHYPLSKKGYAG